MACAGMVLLNVKVDNIVCLDDVQQVLPFFGGERPAHKRLILTINAVEDEHHRAGAEKRLQYGMVRQTLDQLAPDDVFYVSARHVLACGRPHGGSDRIFGAGLSCETKHTMQNLGVSRYGNNQQTCQNSKIH